MFVPEPINDVIDELFASDGVEAIVVGGSRAIGRERPDSDWDIGVYYRGTLDTMPLAAHGDVFAPGSWGRIMNGGAWLTIADTSIDVLLRDLDAVEHWTAEAAAGRFDIDGLPGYVAGIPTYSLTAEASVSHAVRGSLTVEARFPDALRELAPGRWRHNRNFSLHHAEMHARRGNAVGALGQAARAVLEEANARCCEVGTWVLNDKHVLEAVHLDDIHPHFVLDSSAAADLTELVRGVRARLSDVTDRPDE